MFLISTHLLPVLGDGAEVGLHLGTLGLQRDHLVDDHVGVFDLLQFRGRQNRKLLCRIVLDGVKGELTGLKNTNKNEWHISKEPNASAGVLHSTNLLLPVLNLVFVFRYGGLDLLDPQPDAEGLLLQRVLLLLESLDLLQHPLILLLHLRKGGLQDDKIHSIRGKRSRTNQNK